MTLLLIIGAAVVLVAVGAATERWRTARVDAVPPDDAEVTLRYRFRPGDRTLDALLRGECEAIGVHVVPPVWGDRWMLVDGPRIQLAELSERLVDVAIDAGYVVFRRRGRRVVLRRGVRFLTLEAGAG